MGTNALKQRAHDARSWLHDACFPLWADQGAVAGGFCEALDLKHVAISSNIARVRVQARQTFMFSAAKHLGWSPAKADELIGLGLRTLETSCSNKAGLFTRRLDLQTGQPVSDEADLYDTAFALLAMASARQAGFETSDLMDQTVLALETQFSDPTGGYAETLPRSPYRLQNPHMHLFESCLEAFEVTNDKAHLQRAAALRGLCIDRFIDPETGILGEAFEPSNWQVADGDKGEAVEPGHQFEWVWLFEKYARLSGTGLPDQAKRLYEFACSTVSETGLVVQAVRRDGSAHDSSARTWPQTEALKAHLTMHRAGDEGATARAVQSFDLLMETYLTDKGGWRDHFSADGELVVDMMPASTGYHVVVAFLDLIETFGA